MRKEQKLVLGFVGTVAALVGTLHVYLPFYSQMGAEAQIRAGRGKPDDESPRSATSRSASMWKNMDKKTRD